jgi:hypothetical protein
LNAWSLDKLRDEVKDGFKKGSMVLKSLDSISMESDGKKSPSKPCSRALPSKSLRKSAESPERRSALSDVPKLQTYI